MHPLWQKALDAARTEYGEKVAATWFAPIRVLEIDERAHRARFEAPDSFFRERFHDRFEGFVARQWTVDASEPYVIDWVTRAQDAPLPPPARPAPERREAAAAPAPQSEAQTEAAVRAAGMNPEYSFESFVVGPENRFAYEACLAVAEGPGRKQFNPLFLHGATGLGKTHLVTAIGRKALQRDPRAKIVYMSGETFTNGVIEGIRRKTMSELRERLSGTRILIVDDIHFIAGKASTQEEFFHRFNDLYARGCHIILTSDRKPHDIPHLEERLRSRFAGGFIDEIRLPDWETKVAILEKKAEHAGVALPPEVAHFLARSVESSVRELEGVLNRLVAHASIYKAPISMDQARRVLADSLTQRAAEPTVEDIQKAVAKHFGLKVADLKAARRHKNVVEPRQIAMYVARKLTRCSFPEIGCQFGGRDHSTVMHSVEKVERRIAEEDSKFRYPVEIILKNFQG